MSYFSEREKILWAYKMADLGLMPAVENFDFKAFPDEFVGPVLYQATARDTEIRQN